MQTKLHSALEVTMNVVSGMLIAFLISQLASHYETFIQTWIWAGFKWKVSAGGNAIMTVILTIVSVVRGYIWRRYFNNKILRRYKHEAAKK